MNLNLYEQVSSIETPQNNSFELLERRNDLYNSLQTQIKPLSNNKLGSLCASFLVKIKVGDGVKKLEKISRTTGMPMNSEKSKTAEQVLGEFMDEIENIDDSNTKIQLIQSLSQWIKFEYDNGNQHIDKGVAKIYTKKLKHIMKSDPECMSQLENNPELASMIDMDDYDGKSIGEILSHGLVIIGVVALGVERLGNTFKSKSKKEQEEAKKKYEEYSKELIKQNLERLKKEISRNRESGLEKQRKKLDEYNKQQHEKPLPEIYTIDKSTTYATLVKTLLYGKETAEVKDIHISFAQAVNTIINSKDIDTETHTKNFEIMLDPSNDEILQAFLTNLANTPSARIENNLLQKLRNLTKPIVIGKLESYNTQAASYNTREIKSIQLEIAFYISDYRESHPGEDKSIPLPYQKDKKNKLGYPDIFAIPKKNSPDSKELTRVLDITWYIYAMESQTIFEDGANTLGQIFDYLAVLPEWDLQRQVVIEFAHKYRTINALRNLDNNKDNQKRPEIPEKSNYRSYLFQLINSSFLGYFMKSKAEGESLNQASMQEGPETDEQLIKKYMLYLIQLSEQKIFTEKVSKLQKSIDDLNKTSAQNQKEYNILAEDVQKAYSDLTTLLKQNNNTRSWLYKMAGSPIIMGGIISPTARPLDSDDPREKALFEQYKNLYNQMNDIEKKTLDAQHTMAKKQAQFFGLTTKNNANYFLQTYSDQYNLSFLNTGTSLSKIPGKLQELQTTINSSNFEIKNNEGGSIRKIRTVDVYNQLRSNEGFNYAKHVSIPNPIADEAEIIAIFGGNNEQGRNNITTYLKKKGVNPNFAYTTHYQPKTPKSIGEYKVQTETADSPSYKKKQIQALCQVLHKVTIPGMGNYITENIPAEAFAYLQNRERIFRDSAIFNKDQANQIITKINDKFTKDNNSQTQARFILLPTKNEGEPYSLFYDGMDLWKNLYFAKIDAEDNIGIIGMPPHNLVSPATSDDPFIYKKPKDEGAVSGYAKALQAQQERQLILDNDPLLQGAETLLLEIQGIAAPLLQAKQLYDAGNNGDEILTDYLDKQTAILKATLSSGKPRTKRQQMQDAVTHIRMYIAKYENTSTGSDIMSNYEATILKYKSISRELEEFSTMNLVALDSRDAAGLYNLLKTVVVIAGTIAVTIATGGSGLPFVATAGISVASGMIVGRFVDEGRYIYLNHVSPISYNVQMESGTVDTKLVYNKRSDFMEAVEGKREWGEVLVGMGKEFSIGMFRYMIGAGLVKVGSNGLTRFHNSIKKTISKLKQGSNLQKTFQTIDNLITNKLSQHIDILESQGMKNFFKQFVKEYPQEMTEEGLGDLGQKLGGDYGGPVGAVIEALINIKSKNKSFTAGGVKVRPSITKGEGDDVGSNTEVRYAEGIDISGIKEKLTGSDMGRVVEENTETGILTATKMIDGKKHTMAFKSTTEHPAIMDIQTDPELSKYTLSKKEGEDDIYNAVVFDNQTEGPNKQDRMQLLRYKNLIIMEEGDDYIIARDSNGKAIRIEFVKKITIVPNTDFDFEIASDAELVQYFENSNPKLLYYVGEQPTLQQKADFIRLSGGLFLLTIPGKLIISKKSGQEDISQNKYEIKLELAANNDPKNDATSEYILDIGTDNGTNYVYIRSMSIPKILYGNKSVDGYELVNETLQQGIKIKEQYPHCFVNGQGAKHGKNGRYSFARYGFAVMYPGNLEAEVRNSNLDETLKQAIIAECQKEGGHPLDILMNDSEGRKWRGDNPKTEQFVFNFNNEKHIEAAKKYKEMKDNLKLIREISALDQSTLSPEQSAEKQRLISRVMSINDANFDIRIKIAGILLGKNPDTFDDATVQLIEDIHESDYTTTKGRLIIDNRSATQLNRKDYQKLMEWGVCGKENSEEKWSTANLIQKINAQKISKDAKTILTNLIIMADEGGKSPIAQLLGLVLFKNDTINKKAMNNFLSILSLDKSFELHRYLIEQSRMLEFNVFGKLVTALINQNAFANFSFFISDNSNAEMTVSQFIQIINNHVLVNGQVKESITQQLEEIQKARSIPGANYDELRKRIVELKKQLTAVTDQVARAIPILEAYIYNNSGKTISDIYNDNIGLFQGLDLETVGSILVIIYDVVTAHEQIHTLMESGKDNVTILSEVLAKDVTETGIQSNHFKITNINDTMVFQFTDRRAYLTLYYGKGVVIIKPDGTFFNTQTNKVIIPSMGVNIPNISNGFGFGCAIIRPGMNQTNTLETIVHEGIHTENHRLLPWEVSTYGRGGIVERHYEAQNAYVHLDLQNEIIAQLGGERGIQRNILIRDLTTLEIYDFVASRFGKEYSESVRKKAVNYNSLKEEYNKYVEKYVDLALLVKDSGIPHRIQLLRLYPIQQRGKLINNYHLLHRKVGLPLISGGVGRANNSRLMPMPHETDLFLINGMLMNATRQEAFEGSIFGKEFINRFGDGSAELQYLLCKEGSGITDEHFQSLLALSPMELILMDPIARESQWPGINSIIQRNIPDNLTFLCDQLGYSISDMTVTALDAPRGYDLNTHPDFKQLISYISPIHESTNIELYNMRRKAIARELLGREVGDEIIAAHEATTLREKVEILKNANPPYTSDEIRILCKWYVCGRVVDMESKPLIPEISGIKSVFGHGIQFDHYTTFNDPKLDKDYLKNPLTYERAMAICGFDGSKPELFEMIDHIEINEDYYNTDTISIDIKLLGGGVVHIAYDTSNRQSITLSLIEKNQSDMEFYIIFDQIIANAKKMGINHIELNAAKFEKEGHIGYSLWPLYGFTERGSSRPDIINNIRNQLHGKTPAQGLDPKLVKELEHINNRFEKGYYASGSNHSIIRDIYAIVVSPSGSGSLTSGYEFWKKYGCEFYGEFLIGTNGEQTQHEREFQRYKKRKEKAKSN